MGAVIIAVAYGLAVMTGGCLVIFWFRREFYEAANAVKKINKKSTEARL